MLEVKDIDKLAKLARIELTEEEKQKLLTEVEPILGYVTQIKEVASTMNANSMVSEHRNITRGDENITVSGTNTADIVADMPDSERNYLKVKKIL